ncbi:MAG: AAA family ATPase [Gammaproteobacteria bacterium]|jgi:MoxR-like ATPase
MSSHSSNPIQSLFNNLSRVIYGKNEVLLFTLTTLLCRGHLLIEDVPGLGKTTLAKSLARSLDMAFNRIQCTPDLMPSDITGINVYNSEEHRFHFLPGPVFTDILLADEINRATPRTQSALLEAMAERSVSLDRKIHSLSANFMVIATQNPVESAGTYPLPEAQLDRFFMRIGLGYPDQAEEIRILTDQPHRQALQQLQPVMTPDQLQQFSLHAGKTQLDHRLYAYITDLVRATREHPSVRLGSSPRGSLALAAASKAYAFLAGKKFVTPDIVQKLIEPVLGHRLIFNDAHLYQPDARAQFFNDLMSRVVVPDHAETAA